MRRARLRLRQLPPGRGRPARPRRRGGSRPDRRLRGQHRRPAAPRGPAGDPGRRGGAAHRSLVVSPMLVLGRVVPGMRERRFGRVLAVSSCGAIERLPGLQLSNANRPGLLAAMKLLARENAAHGVRFNAVLPGRIATDPAGVGLRRDRRRRADGARRDPRGAAGHARGGRRRRGVSVLGRGGLRDGAAVARRRRSHPLLVVAGAGAIGAAERPKHRLRPVGGAG